MTLIQGIENTIHYSAEIMLLGISIYTFVSINKYAGTLLIVYSVYSLVFQMAFQGLFGLGVIAEILMSTDWESGPPTFNAHLIGISGGISKFVLAIGVLMLVRHTTMSLKAGAGNVS
jgi:hypothetical protein